MVVVKFGILGVPKNWSNWTPNRMALYAQKKEWLENTVILGRIARVKSAVGIAEKGHSQRTILIHQRRRGVLDKDGLFASAKPIIDGCKTKLRRKVNGKFEAYVGAGLIFDDDPSHVDWNVTQEKTTGEPQVWIEVEIPES